jgi:hypothetical protein
MSDETKIEGAIKLEDGDFYRWMYLNEVVNRKEAEMEVSRSQMEMAHRNLNAYAAAVLKKHDVTFEEYSLDVSTQSLIPKNKKDDKKGTSTRDTEGVVQDE